MTKSIKHTFNYNHKPAVVWDYLTKPELIVQWLMPCDFKPEVGHEFKFTTKPMPQFGFNGIIYCKVLEVVPNKKLVYSWKGGPGDSEAFTLDSVVTWDLKETNTGTELFLEHSGFTDANATAIMVMDAGWKQNIARVDELATSKEVRRTWFFEQPATVVWDYLTKPELIETWLMKSDFKPVAGHKFKFMYKERIDAYCEVLKIDAPKFLSFAWRKGKSEEEIRLDSVVSWTLTEKNGGTELKLAHTGFTLFEDVLGHSWGWDVLTKKLTEDLKTTTHANTKA